MDFCWAVRVERKGHILLESLENLTIVAHLYKYFILSCFEIIKLLISVSISIRRNSFKVFYSLIMSIPSNYQFTCSVFVSWGPREASLICLWYGYSIVTWFINLHFNKIKSLFCYWKFYVNKLISFSVLADEEDSIAPLEVLYFHPERSIVFFPFKEHTSGNLSGFFGPKFRIITPCSIPFSLTPRISY